MKVSIWTNYTIYLSLQNVNINIDIESKSDIIILHTTYILMSIPTLFDLENQVFPLSEDRLYPMILKAEEAFNIALQEFITKKSQLLAKNKGPIHSWPNQEQEKWFAEISRIDAITLETLNYIKNLVAEITQIPI